MLTAIADGLRNQLAAALVDADAPVCRLHLRPGATVAWDTCCECLSDDGDGQGWVGVNRTFPSSAIVEEDFTRQGCGSVRTVELEAGIIRCAHTVDSRGRAPTVTELDGDAGKVFDDHGILLDAACRLIGSELSDGCTVGSRDVVIGPWEPVGPEGRCAGGVLTVWVTLT